jgi:Disulphide bond corrector protein DsbC
VIGPSLDLSSLLSLSAKMEPARLRPGERGRLVVEVTVPQGCHIESHRPNEPWLIPTVLGVEAPEGIAAGEVSYPEGVERAFDWSPSVLRVYRGTFELWAPVKVGLGASPGSVAVLAKLSYQGCTESLCLVPSEQSAEARLEIATG